MQSRFRSLNFCAKDFYSGLSEKHEISVNWYHCMFGIVAVVLRNVTKSLLFRLAHCRLGHEKKKIWLLWRKCCHSHLSAATNWSTRWKPLYLCDWSFIKHPSSLCQSFIIKPHSYVLVVAVKGQRSFKGWFTSRKVFLLEALYFLSKKKNSERIIYAKE